MDSSKHLLVKKMSYKSTGHASVIDAQSGKVLEFDVRSKTCRVCQYHFERNETVPNHNCSSNWSGLYVLKLFIC